VSLLAGADPDVLYPAATAEMGESGLRSRVRTRAFIALGYHFAARSDCFVRSERNFYYGPNPDREFAVPDVFVSFGVDPGPLELTASYLLWESGAPAFVLAVASTGIHRRDRRHKRRAYREMGAGEYWPFDATGGELFEPMLQGDRLAGGAWAPIPAAAGGGGLVARSAALGLDLRAEAGRLRLRDPRTGLWLADHEEIRRQRDAAEDRSDAAEAARRGAEDRAAAAEAELAALRARLNDRDADTGR